MNKTIQLYVKPTSNSEGMELQTFELLSPTWTGDKLRLPFGEPPKVKRYNVVGWTNLFTGQPCPVNVAYVRAAGGAIGWLVWGGNSGVRILDRKAPIIPGTEHLPRGYGQPVVWVEDINDLPGSVRRVVETSERPD